MLKKLGSLFGIILLLLLLGTGIGTFSTLPDETAALSNLNKTHYATVDCILNGTFSNGPYDLELAILDPNYRQNLGDLRNMDDGALAPDEQCRDVDGFVGPRSNLTLDLLSELLAFVRG